MKTFFFAFMALLTSSVFALDMKDEQAIHSCIENYAFAWNERCCHGFADDFTDNADFVNIFGMHFTGKAEIEQRHISILETFLKGTKLRITDIVLREEQPGLVIATVRWTLEGFVKRDPNGPDIKQGVFTHVFVLKENSWKISATQNTLTN